MDNSSKVEMDYKQDSHYEETVMMKSPKTYEEQVKIIKTCITLTMFALRI